MGHRDINSEHVCIISSEHVCLYTAEDILENIFWKGIIYILQCGWKLRPHWTFLTAKPKCLEISQIYIEYIQTIRQMCDKPWKFFI